VLGCALLVIGIILLIVGGAGLGWYPSRIGGPANWLDDRFYHPIVHWLTVSPYWPASAGLVFGIALILSFGGYALAARRGLREGRGRRRDLWLVIAVQGGLATWLAIQPYLSSQDIFSYAYYAHMYLWYHANPYLAVPRDFPWDPLFSAIFWKDQPSNYGPLWTYLSLLAPIIAGALVGPTILVLKTITILAMLGGTPLIWSALGRLSPERRLFGTILYAWNPLLIVESALAGHNDVVMAFFLALAVWFWTRDRRTLTIGALVLAALVKYVAIILVPLFLLAWWRGGHDRPLRILWTSALVGVALVAAGFAPVFAGVRTFAIIGFGTNDLAYTNSPLELAFRQLRIGLGDPTAVATLPLHYRGYWVGVDPSTILWSAPNSSQTVGIALPENEPLLVVEPPGGEWLHVYEPRLGRFGFVQYRETHAISAPRLAQTSELTAVVLDGASQDPSARESNLILRVSTGVIFLVLYVLVGSAARDDRSVFERSLAVLMLFLVAVQGWFWPWYLVWGLPLVAVVPDSFAALALLGLSVTTSVLNAQPNVNPSPVVEWIYELRVVAIDGLPLLVVSLIWWRRRPVVWRHIDRESPPGRKRAIVVGEQLRQLLKVRAVRALGIALVLAGTLVIIETTSAPAASDQPGPVVLWQRAYSDAQREFSAHQYGAAVDSLNLVISEQPNDEAAIRLRLASYLQMQRYSDAIPDASLLLARDPSNVDLRLERGTLYLHVQRADLAMRDFETVMAIEPSFAYGYEGAGLAATQQGSLDFASDMLWQAHILAPTDGKISQELADVLATKGDMILALRLDDQAVQRLPDDATVYADRAAMRRYAGLDQSTVPDLQRVLVLSGDLEQHQWADQLLQTLTSDSGTPPNVILP